MKTPADIVQTLGELRTQDRKWIVDRLSLSARRTLLDERDGRNERGVQAMPSATPQLESTKPAPTLPAVERVAHASVSSVATALSGEPTWVMHALLQHQAWEWREGLLRALSARVRSELAQLDASAVRYSAKTLERLVAALAPRVQPDIAGERNQAAHEPSAIASRFEKLVGGFGTKFAQQRLRLRT